MEAPDIPVQSLDATHTPQNPQCSSVHHGVLNTAKLWGSPHHHGKNHQKPIRSHGHPLVHVGVALLSETPRLNLCFLRLHGVKTVETRNWPMLKDVSGASDARCSRTAWNPMADHGHVRSVSAAYWSQDHGRECPGLRWPEATVDTRSWLMVSTWNYR